MAIVRTGMIDDDGSGTTGTILNNAWKQELYAQIDAYVGGNLIVPGFAPADFTANNGATWTVTSAQTWYLITTDKLMFMSVNVTGSTISGPAPSNLNIKIPGGRASAGYAVGTTYVNGPGVSYEVGIVLVVTGGGFLLLHRPAIGAFPIGSVSVYASVMIPLA